MIVFFLVSILIIIYFPFPFPFSPAAGFTSGGVAAGSIAASMMSSAAIANGGAVAAGSAVRIMADLRPLFGGSEKNYEIVNFSIYIISNHFSLHFLPNLPRALIALIFIHTCIFVSLLHGHYFGLILINFDGGAERKRSELT